MQSNVISFENHKTQTEDITLLLTPKEAKRAKEFQLACMTVRGDEFGHEGIFDGDKVLYEKAYDERLIPGRICLVEIDGFQGRYLRRIRKDGNNFILEASEDEQPIIVKPGQFSVKGVVTAIWRHYDHRGSFNPREGIKNGI